MDNQAAREILSNYLKQQGNSRATSARFAVLNEVLRTQGHFDVESLYYRLITSGVKVSKATVYNTLDLLLNCGLVSKYRFAENTSRYEKAFGRPHHHHLICLKCGDIIEFMNENLQRIQDDVCRDKRFDPQSTTFQIFGTCARCAKIE
jgi:Fur family ferric uptake transcriptional regulator